MSSDSVLQKVPVITIAAELDSEYVFKDNLPAKGNAWMIQSVLEMFLNVKIEACHYLTLTFIMIKLPASLKMTRREIRIWVIERPIRSPF